MKKIKEQIQSAVDINKSGNFSEAELLTKKLINIAVVVNPGIKLISVIF